jgi:CRISPR-associated protein Cas2
VAGVKKELYVLLCYDISKAPRRAKLQRRLARHLVHVQQSVFEGTVSAHRLDQIIKLVEATVDLENDTVRIYLLCSGCAESTILLGTAEAVEDRRDPWLF